MRSIRVLGACALLGIASQHVMAADGHGAYIGAGAGQIKATEKGYGVSASTTGYKGFVGFDFNRFVGIEGAYIGGNILNASIDGVTLSEKVRAGQASVLGRIPFSDNFAVFARAGALFWQADQSAFDSASGVGATVSTNGTNFEWGAGALLSFEHLALRAEFEQANITDYRYRLISGSVIYRF